MGTAVVLAILLVVIVLAVRSLLHDKGSCSGCGGGCSGCSGHCSVTRPCPSNQKH
ncbi:MAG: FeoB-associated Cys-rich membrane protein [Butyricicoccaceae bacterium]